MKVLGALTIAAALTMTMMTACSSDDNFVENRNSEQQTRNAVTVTVGAGISDAMTRSDVVDVDGKRALTFTTGDRLYVYGEIDASTSVAGYLDMVGSPTNSNKSATFSGTLKAYDISGATPVETTMPAGDPFALCTNKTASATLIHKDLNTDAIRVTLGAQAIQYTDYMSAANVETLMETALPVQGNYDSGTNSFTLSSINPIFNCSLSGLPASTDCEVGLYYYHESMDIWVQRFRNTFTSTAEGKIDVAFVSSFMPGNKFWKINVNATGFERNIHLGTKELTAKVYSVTRDLTNKTFADATAGDVGKYIYADGSVNATFKGAFAVAMIAYVGSEGSADASSKIYHGLAIALKDANPGSDEKWGSTYQSDAVSSSETLADHKTFLNGIADTETLITTYGADYAAAKAKNYDTKVAPTGTSGWFLPSSGQWMKFLEAVGVDVTSWGVWSSGGSADFTKVNANLDHGTYATPLSGWRWSSSEYDNMRGVSVNFDSTNGVTFDHDAKVTKLFVRPFFAF